MTNNHQVVSIMEIKMRKIQTILVNEDIGGGRPGGMEPFVILHGHHGYMIQPLGVTERAAINKEYQEMLARLCNITDVWCLPKDNWKGQ
jgi:hypothetical protein